MKVNEGIGKLVSMWRAIAPRKRLVILAAAVATFGLLAGWAYFASRPEYVVLYNRLEAKDANAIAEVLAGQGTPYRLADDGRTILVPSRHVHQARLTLAGEGLPMLGSPGFELLDSVSIGATDFERRNNYIRALSGELARTIGQIEQIQSARVHIVLPEQSLFTSQARPTTAAVFVEHRPNAQLDPDQVAGIVHLVSHSVEGLSAEMVSVVDSQGRVLQANTSGANPSAAERAASTADASRQFSRELEANLQRLLEQVLGPGNVATRVAAELSLEESVVSRRFFEPVADGQGIVRSSEELTESSRGVDAGDGGPAGTQSNVPLYQSDAEGGRVLSERDKSHVSRNYEVNETNEQTVIAPGAVKRLSVSVVVNSQLAPAEVERIEKIVAAAVGSDPARNDQIVVTGMEFDTTLAATIATDMAAARRNQMIAIGGGAALALIAGLLLAARARRNARRRAAAEVVLAEEAAAELPPVDQVRKKNQEELKRLFRTRPQAAAEIIRSWLVEE